MTIDLLQSPLKVSDTPGLSTIDPRFADIVTLVQEARYEEAARQAEEIIEEDIFDIRIIGYYMYGVFLQDGLSAVGDIFTCLAGLIKEDLPALGPEKNREKHIQTILNWLLSQLWKKIEYEEKKQSGLWDTWLSGTTSGQLDDAREAADVLRKTLGPALEDLSGPVLDSLLKVGDKLSTLQQLLYQEPEPEEAFEEEIEEDEVETETSQPAPPHQPSAASPSWPTANDQGVDGAYHLQLLLQKMQAFDSLVTDGKISLAALVADDVNHLIANFDPRIYFPKLFSKFSLQFAVHADELVAFSEMKQSPGWQALRQLYDTDLESFLKFVPDSITFDSSGESNGFEGHDGYKDMPVDEHAGPEENEDEQW